VRFFKKRKSTPLTQEELEREIRERADSKRNAMGDPLVGNVYGDGSFTNSISRAQFTVNEGGIESIIARRVFEPRQGQSQSDQEAL
jgi:hypothetical protein